MLLFYITFCRSKNVYIILLINISRFLILLPFRYEGPGSEEGYPSKTLVISNIDALDSEAYRCTCLVGQNIQIQSHEVSMKVMSKYPFLIRSDQLDCVAFDSFLLASFNKLHKSVLRLKANIYFARNI